MRTRLLSLLLVLVTVLSLLPTSALAASSTGTGIKPTSNTNYWTTRLLHDGTPYSYKPPMAAGKMLYCMDRGYGYRWGTPSFLNSYTYSIVSVLFARTLASWRQSKRPIAYIEKERGGARYEGSENEGASNFPTDVPDRCAEYLSYADAALVIF